MTSPAVQQHREAGAARGSHLSARAADRSRWFGPAFVGVLALAAIDFSWQLGSSSFYVDEVQAVVAASSRIGHLLHVIAHTELTPPAYFFFLHEWMLRTGSTAEWVLRLPSAIGGVFLVAAIWWLAARVTDRQPVALGAALLTALSPFVLQYAQLAEGYVFGMLAVTVAYAAAIETQRRQGGEGRWLILSGLSSVVALGLHFTAALVIAPLCLWVWRRRRLDIRWRLAFGAACGVTELALLPLALVQHAAIPHRGAAASAKLTGANLARMLEIPFDGRVDIVRAVGVAITVGSLVVLISRAAPIRPWRLFTAVTVGEPLVLIVASVFGADLMLTRYAAVATPFIIIAIAAAPAAVGRRAPAAGLLLAAGVTAVAVAGVIGSHRRSGFYLDARAATRFVRVHRRPGDLVAVTSDPGATVPLLYYGGDLHPAVLDQREAARAFGQRHHPVWLVFELPAGGSARSSLLSLERRGARLLGFRIVTVTEFPGVLGLAVARLVPTA